MKTKLYILSALLLIIFAFSACSPKDEPTKTLRIGLAIYSQEDTFIGTLVSNFQTMAQEREIANNMKITVNVVDAGGSQNTQNAQIDRFLSLSYDIICVNIVDRTAAAVLIDKAKKADVPIIFFNREPVSEDMERWGKVFYVGSRASVAGQMQGEIIVKAWNDESLSMDKNGDGILQYVLLEGEPGHQDALLRTEYSLKVLENNGIELEQLGQATASWQRGQALSKMSQWLKSYGKGIELVLSNNDDMALGAIDAYKALDVPLVIPIIVGVDATPAALTAIEDGDLYATVLNDGTNQAKNILDLAYCLYENENPKEVFDFEDGNYIWNDYELITKNN